MQLLQNLSRDQRHLASIGAGLMAAMLLTVLCYWPSLNGPFLFDDVPNLELLGERGGLDTAAKTIDFISNTQSSPLGRPVSLFSFTLDGQNWPTDPRPFRVSNLIIHLINGLLIFFLTRGIFGQLQQRETANWLAVTAATLWLLHPLLVSTTAYIIQRMTQLGTLFTLAGLLCYMHGRLALPISKIQGWSWIVAGMGISGLLAVLSKEIGILLPLYALAIEVTVFSRTALAKHQRTLLISLLCAPLVMLIAYFAWSWGARIESFDFRDFSLSERLLTQAVVLIEYLRQIVMPGLAGLGVFHDDFPISRGLLSPPATLVSLLLIAVLITVAVWTRKRYSLVSLGILWFFIGHSLEAGPVSLELYFEHRNYLPLLGPLVAILSLLPLLKVEVRRFLPLLLVFIVAMQSFITWQSATAWGNEALLMRTTLIDHPDSLRAQQYVANQHIIAGRYREALAAQEALALKYPRHTATRLSILNLRCLVGDAIGSDVRATREFLLTADFDFQITGYLGPLAANASSNTCTALGDAEVYGLFDALLQNPLMLRVAELRGAVHYFKGIGYYQRQNLALAIDELDLSYGANPEIDIRFQQIAWLLAAERPDDAERYLILASQHEKAHWLRANVRDQDFAHYRNNIAAVRQAMQQRD